MKRFTLGFITGSIIAAAVTGFAVEYAITANPYPVKVNGTETAIEGYNINDSTYFKLRDVADAVGGFSVDFKDNAIVLDTETEPTAAPTPTVKADLSPLPELPVEKRSGIDYVNTADIEKMLKELGLGQYKFTLFNFIDENDPNPFNSLLSDIPHCENDILLIPLDYYTSTVIPVINSLR